MFAWSHTTYAVWKGIIFNFEWQRDLKYFLAHANGAKRITAVDALRTYNKLKMNGGIVRVCASCSIGANSYRKHIIDKWWKEAR